MKGRTYRYMKEEPLYPFGHGLSYTKFEYSDLKISNTKISQGETVKAYIRISNVGEVSSDDVILMYIKDIEASVDVPNKSLKGIKRITLNSTESTIVEFDITSNMLELIDNNGNKKLEKGEFEIIIGEQSCTLTVE